MIDIRIIGASPFLYSTDKESKKPNDFTIFADSIADIQKALAPDENGSQSEASTGIPGIFSCLFSDRS